MRINKKRLLSALATLLLIALTITSCVGVSPGIPEDNPPENGGNENGENQNGGNSSGDGNTHEKLYLIDEGKVNFSFVYSFTELSDDFKSHIFLGISSLQQRGIFVDAVRDDLDPLDTEYEVLVGTFVGRESATMSKYLLGNKGYTIHVNGNKIVLLGGTEAALQIAFDTFILQHLNFDEGTKNVTIDADFDKTVRETYAITSLSVEGVDLNEGGFKFVCDPHDRTAIAAAQLMQMRMYDYAGYYIPMSPSHSGKAIYVSSEAVSDNDGFRVYTENGSLYIKCQYPEIFESQMNQYLLFAISEDARGDIELGNLYSNNLHSVSYFDFGAVGDGVTDDFLAIKAAHEFANAKGLKVNAVGADKSRRAVFHLGAHADTIRIQTNVDWTGAEFIIDDTLFPASSNIRTKDVFAVVSSLTVNTQLKNKLTSIKKDATNIGFALDQTYLVILYNSNVKQYIRYGANANSGSDQQEVIIVHENGDIDENTPLLWNYDTVTDVKMYPASDVPITITGGKFTTIANAAPREYTYYHRGIAITRSNVTVSGVTHIVTAEGNTGAPYNGFLYASCANNVLFENIVFSGHKTYKLSSDSNNSMGTYDIGASKSNAITWKNCTQANSITDKTRWGIMGSNFCKNLTYDGCTLSRFDAHQGMYNSTIINSEIGHAGITAIGSGYLRIENTKVNSNDVLQLRYDYGSTWDGVITIKDVTLNNSGNASVISGNWYNHYFGYECHLPNVIIDNLKINKGTSVTVFRGFSSSNITNPSSKNPVSIGGTVTVKNNNGAYKFTVATNSSILAAVTLVEE